VYKGVILLSFIDYTQSYSVSKREFVKGLRGRYFKSLSTWVKMLLCDKGFMKLESDHPSI
jgi:hypothetical protein